MHMKTKSIRNLLKTTIAGLSLMIAPSLFAGGNHDTHAHGHHHEEKTAGPNGGRIVRAVEPRFELLVREDRKIQITFLNNENKPITPEGQVFTAITGKRSNPTNMMFEVHEGILLSDKALPEGNNLPMILNIKNTAEGAIHRERFILNLGECPSCDYKEYACVCGH